MFPFDTAKVRTFWGSRQIINYGNWKNNVIIDICQYNMLHKWLFGRFFVSLAGFSWSLAEVSLSLQTNKQIHTRHEKTACFGTVRSDIMGMGR